MTPAQFLKKIFPLALCLFIVVDKGYSSPKRLREESKNTSSLSPAAERRSEEELERVEEDNREVFTSNKRARGGSHVEIPEYFSQGSASASSGGEESSSTSQQTRNDSPVLLPTKEIPFLYELALKAAMRLPADHRVFQHGLPLELHTNLIEPSLQSIQEMINELAELCQQEHVRSLAAVEQNCGILFTFKKWLQDIHRHYQAQLEEKDYPGALFHLSSIKNVFPYLEKATECLKQRSFFQQQALACQNDSEKKHFFLKSLERPLEMQAYSLIKISDQKRQLEKNLLLSPASLTKQQALADKILANEENVTQLDSLLRNQKLFLDQDNNYDTDSLDQENVARVFCAAFQTLRRADQATELGDKERVSLLREIANNYEQILEILVSRDTRVNQMKQKLLEIYSILGYFASQQEAIFRNQKELLYRMENRIVISRQGLVERKTESYIPIFQLYDVPISFLRKESTLLKEAKSDLVMGKNTLSANKIALSRGWNALASEVAHSVNVCGQLGMMCSPEEILNEDQTAEKNNLLNLEQQLNDAAAIAPIDFSITSLPWDFNKTFEENVGALPN